MHNLRPLTDYKIVTIQIAAIAELDDAEITDGLNEMLRACCKTGEGIVDDWQFVPTSNPIHRSSDTPEESELFK